MKYAEFIEFFKTTSAPANALASFAVILLLIKVFLLNEYPAATHGVYQAGLIIEAIMASVVASYIFYLIVVHAKEYADKVVLKPFISGRLTGIVRVCEEQLGLVAKQSGVDLDFSEVTESQMVSAFEKIEPYSTTPIAMSVNPTVLANWFQYFGHHEVRTKASIKQLLGQIIYLDARAVSALVLIENCSHFQCIKLLGNKPVSNENLAPWGAPFYKYVEMCRNLQSYLKANGMYAK